MWICCLGCLGRKMLKATYILQMVGNVRSRYVHAALGFLLDAKARPGTAREGSWVLTSLPPYANAGAACAWYVVEARTNTSTALKTNIWIRMQRDPCLQEH